MVTRSPMFPRLIQDAIRRVGRSRGRSRWQNVRLLTGLLLFCLYLVGILCGPLLVQHAPLEQDLSNALLAPSAEHLLGTDEFGRDILSRVVHGGRLSLQIAVGATIVPTIVGTIIGLIVGYFAGLVDLLVMRLLEVLMAFPGYILALVIVAALGPGTENMIIAIAIYLIPRFALVSRRAAFQVVTSEYISAAQVMGYRSTRILLVHMLPNCLTPLIAELSTTLGVVILVTSGLSFLGLGPQRPTPEWGLMLSDSRQYLWTAPHTVLAPGIAISGLVLAFNLLGDGLRDALAPAR